MIGNSYQVPVGSRLQGSRGRFPRQILGTDSCWLSMPVKIEKRNSLGISRDLSVGS